MENAIDKEHNEWKFLREGIRFDDDDTAGFVFRFVDIWEVTHFTWDVIMVSYLPFLRRMEMPPGAEIIRIHSSDPKENWCWGKNGTLLIYKAWRDGPNDKRHCYLFIYNLEDATVHRFPMPQNVYRWEWNDAMDAFIVMAGDLIFSTREIKNQTKYIVTAPSVDKRRVARLDSWVELVEEPTPPIGTSSFELLIDSLYVEGEASETADSVPVYEEGGKRVPTTENPNEEGSRNRLSILDIIGLKQLELRMSPMRRKNMRIQLAFVFIGVAIMVMLLVCKLIYG